MNTDYIFIREPSKRDRPAAYRQAKVVPPAMWLVGAVLLVAVLGAVIWCLTGIVTRSISISGIVFPQFGIEQVSCQTDGMVSYIQVEVGDTVEAGDLIAIIPQTQMLEEIQTVQTAGELSAIYDSYQNASMIYTPVSGRVVDLVRTGQYLRAGDLVASVTNADASSNVAEIRAYVSATVAQSIKKGMEVQVYPRFSSDEEYGYIQGLVSNISSYPITETDISGELGRFYSNEMIPQGENIIEIRVTMLAGSDRNTLAWSGTEGDRLSVDIGTLCSMEVILSEMTPWESLW